MCKARPLTRYRLFGMRMPSLMKLLTVQIVCIKTREQVRVSGNRGCGSSASYKERERDKVLVLTNKCARRDRREVQTCEGRDGTSREGESGEGNKYASAHTHMLSFSLG